MNEYFKFIAICPQCGAKESRNRFSVDQLGISVGVVECLRCGILYKTRMPTAKLMNLIYSDTYTHFSQVGEHDGDPDTHASRIDRLGNPNKNNNRHLDYGCGSGSFVTAAIASGWDSYGCDPFLSTNLISSDSESRLFKIGSEDPSLKKTLGEFDIISLWAVTEHMEDITNTFKSLTELLKPGGRIIFNWPYGNSYAARRNGNKWLMSMLVEHLTFATKKSVNHLEVEINMSIEELIICGSPYPFGLSSNPSLDDQGVSGIDMTHIDTGAKPSAAPGTYRGRLSLSGSAKYLLGLLRSLLLGESTNGLLANCTRKIIQFARAGDHLQVILVKK